jgi:hypothetical protein
MAEQEQKNVHIRTKVTVSQARKFLERAAREEEFRARLETSPIEVLGEYGIEILADVVPLRCLLPSPELCEKLLERVAEVDEYGEAEYMPIALAFVIMTVGYAMPLVTTAEAELGAAS